MSWLCPLRINVAKMDSVGVVLFLLPTAFGFQIRHGVILRVYVRLLWLSLNGAICCNSQYVVHLSYFFRSARAGQCSRPRQNKGEKLIL